eukprot:1178705-Prorocentrum_minimum.AAC.2
MPPFWISRAASESLKPGQEFIIGAVRVNEGTCSWGCFLALLPVNNNSSGTCIRSAPATQGNRDESQPRKFTTSYELNDVSLAYGCGGPSEIVVVATIPRPPSTTSDAVEVNHLSTAPTAPGALAHFTCSRLESVLLLLFEQP